jgi:3-hydroxybutyryl-CoA dehydrogenase
VSSIERIFVAGAGLMGHGIAQVHAALGREVTLYEPDLARAQAGRQRIAGNLERSVAKGRLTAEDAAATVARITATDDFKDVVGADLVM